MSMNLSLDLRTEKHIVAGKILILYLLDPRSNFMINMHITFDHKLCNTARNNGSKFSILCVMEGRREGRKERE